MKTAQLIKKIKFDQKGLIPAIIQDAQSKEVLMVAYMNSLAIKKTLETKRTHFWSRSRKKMWMKGESSGHVQIVKRVSLDCDNDTLLVEVRQVSAACHSGYYSCFYKRVNLKTASVKEIGKKMFDPKKVYKK